MALTEFEGSPLDAQNAFYLPIGAASPLWALFAGAASVGMAYWWMVRWTDRTNLEAMFAPAQAPASPVLEAPVLAAPEPIAEPSVVEATPAPVLAEPEPVVAAVAEKLAEPVIAAAEAVADIADTVVEPEPAAKVKAKAKPATEPPPFA